MADKSAKHIAENWGKSAMLQVVCPMCNQLNAIAHGISVRDSNSIYQCWNCNTHVHVTLRQELYPYDGDFQCGKQVDEN